MRCFYYIVYIEWGWVDFVFFLFWNWFLKIYVYNLIVWLLKGGFLVLKNGLRELFLEENFGFMEVLVLNFIIVVNVYIILWKN